MRRTHENVWECGFTLVELLVVVAIISVLAAILLPTLADAMEQGRRTLCTNNQRQLYISLNLYADDNNDRLPFQGAAEPRFFARVYGVPITDSLINWFCGYANVRRGASQWSPLQNDQNRIIDCPSNQHAVEPLSYQSNRVGRNCNFDFALPGIGALFDAAPRRTQAFTNGPLGPKAIVQDFTQAPLGYAWTVGLSYYNNHGQQGGNVLGGSGAVHWKDISRFAKEVGTAGDSGAMRALDYYYQSGANWFYRADGKLYVFAPPSGTFTGGGTVPFSAANLENLRLYGY